MSSSSSSCFSHCPYTFIYSFFFYPNVIYILYSFILIFTNHLYIFSARKIHHCRCFGWSSRVPNWKELCTWEGNLYLFYIVLCHSCIDHNKSKHVHVSVLCFGLPFANFLKINRNMLLRFKQRNRKIASNSCCQ